MNLAPVTKSSPKTLPIPTAPAVSILREIVEERLPPNADVLTLLHQAVTGGNKEAYREALEGVIRPILGRIQGEVAKALGFVTTNAPGQPEAKKVLVSFHGISLILRRWLRVTQDQHIWERTTFSQTEIDYFSSIYDWDARPGHLMTDPEGPDEINVIFCSHNPPNSCCSGSEARHRSKDRSGCSERAGAIDIEHWRHARRLLHSSLFPLLVRHVLDELPDDVFDKSVEELTKSIEARTKGVAIRNADIHSLMELGKFLEPFAFVSKIKTRMLKVRSFLITFFYTIGRIGLDGEPEDGSSCERVVACRCRRSSDAALPGDDVLGSIAVVISHPQRAVLNQVNNLREQVEAATERLARGLRYCELEATSSKASAGASATMDEDRMRRACEIDWLFHGSGTEHLKQLTEPLHNTLKRLIPACATTPLVDRTLKEFFEEFNIVGASPAYVDLLERLYSAVRTSRQGEPQVVFLYSEPGCGKENIAKLIHLFSPRANLSGEQMQLDVPGEEAHYLGDTLEGMVSYKGADKTDVRMSALVSPNPWKINELHRQNLLFNYFTMNMATLYSNDLFAARLFGEYKDKGNGELGRCVMAHLLRGTIFLDEFNTLPNPLWANCFLRLFEKPCEMEIRGRKGGPLPQASMLMICASNLTGEELIAKGFNEAVIYRLTRRTFNIPPLRSRQVDIAIFVNARLRAYNMLKSEPKRRVRQVNPAAMRLLCELPWPDNYRGVQGLLQEILEERDRQGLERPEILFEDAVAGLRRRETLMAATRSGNGNARSGVVTLKIEG